MHGNIIIIIISPLFVFTCFVLIEIVSRKIVPDVVISAIRHQQGANLVERRGRAK